MQIISLDEHWFDRWAELRRELWPECSPRQTRHEYATFYRTRGVVLLAVCGERLVGFLEGTRRDYAQGCSSPGVGYVEGWYVAPQERRRGVGRALMSAFETWCRQQGLTEIGSDAALHDRLAHAAHQGLGFTETDRAVHYLKKLQT